MYGRDQNNNNMKIMTIRNVFISEYHGTPFFEKKKMNGCCNFYSSYFFEKVIP